MLHSGSVPAGMKRFAARAIRGVPILMYHLVSDDVPPSFRSYTVTPRRFASQVRALSRWGFRSISLDELLEAHRQDRQLPRRSVVITFDDGFRDCLRHAAPLLHEAGFGATMYVVAGLLGKTSRWIARDGVDLPLVTLQEARELEQAGVTCQSHALTHPRLAALETAAVARELRVSRAVLEDGLGHQVRHLAYPFGSFDGRVQAEAQAAGYQSASTTQTVKALPHDDVTALPRVKVDGRDGSADFFARLATGKDAGWAMRRLSGATRA